MQVQNKEYWRELCERAINEEDPAKFLAILREIKAVLGLKTEPSRFARCHLCDKPVPLEASKTDEGG